MDEEPRTKLVLPGRKPSRGHSVFLPKKDLTSKYPTETFEAFGAAYYQTQIDKDPVAKEFVIDLFNKIGREYTAQLNQAREQQSPPPDYPTLARTIVQQAFPNYSEPIDPSTPRPGNQVAEAVARERDALTSVAGATLGDVISKGACVCLEQSIILNAILQEKGYFSWIGAGTFNLEEGHAWVGYLQDSNPMMADAVWGFNMPYKDGLARYQQEVGPFQALQSRFLARK